MLKRSTFLISILLFNLNFNLINSVSSELESDIKILTATSVFVSAPFFLMGYQTKKLANNMLKLDKLQLYDSLFNFFSNEKDGFIFISEISKNKNDEKLLKNYLKNSNKSY